jgi:hypothetical protein
MWLDGLGQLKKSNDIIEYRTRDLPACSTVLQPTTLPGDHGALIKRMDNVQNGDKPTPSFHQKLQPTQRCCHGKNILFSTCIPNITNSGVTFQNIFIHCKKATKI